jgi:protocatechuate 3,4-dioxygenase beta subunit
MLKKIEFGEKLANSVAPTVAVVKSGATAQVVLTVTAGATIKGRVHGADGSPIANASVTAVFAPRTSNFPDGFVLHGNNVWRFDSDNEVASDHPLTHVHARSDATGSYTLTGLQPGQQRVIVTASGLCFDRREGVVVADGQTTTLDHELEPAGALQGIAPTDGYLGITRAGDPQPTAIAVLGRDQTFTFAALRPGDYAIAQFHSEPSIDPVVFAHATVVTGRTTFVDLTDAPGPIEIAGQVVNANGPVVDAAVELDLSRVRVDGGGRFAFHRFFPLIGTFELRVTSHRTTFHFACDPAPFGDGGWQGVLRLGDETLRVECRDARGDPVAGDVEVSSDETAGATARPRSIRSQRLALDATGATAVERLVPGRYVVRLHTGKGAEVVNQVDLPRSEVLAIVAPDCGTLEVTLLDADGRPIPKWNIVAGTWLRDGEIPADVEGHDEWFEWRWAPTDRSGRAELRGVRAGRILLKAPSTARDLFLGKQLAPPPVQHLELRADETKSVELRSPARRDGGR